MSNKLHWSYQGTCIKRADNLSKNGKKFSELVLDLPGAKYPSICVCTYWGDLPSGFDVGAEVYADGYMTGREYNGKYYAGLRASNVRVIAAASRPDDSAAGEGQGSMPF